MNDTKWFPANHFFIRKRCSLCGARFSNQNKGLPSHLAVHIRHGQLKRKAFFNAPSVYTLVNPQTVELNGNK